MRGLNKVTLIGNLGKTPELQTLANGIVLTKLALATTEIYKDENGQFVNETEWHQIILWRNLAELACQYLQKGSLIYLEGKIKTRSYFDKDNTKRYVTEIIGEHFIILDKKISNESKD